MKLFVSPKVDARGLRLRTLPGFNGNIVTILQSGESVETLDAENIVQASLGVNNQWLHVRTSEGQIGFCAAWLMVASTGPTPAPPGNPGSAPVLQPNPHLKQQNKHIISRPQTLPAPGQNLPEDPPLSISQPPFSPHTLASSSELTPLPAPQLVPETLEIHDPISTPPVHQVPMLAQGDLYGNAACSPASACMLLEYYHQLDPLNRTVSPQQLIAMLDPGDGVPGRGMSLSNVTDELLALGYQHISEKIHATLADLKTELLTGPLIVTVGVTLTSLGQRRIQGPGDTIHAMVVRGCTPDAIIVNDPWTGRVCISRRQHLP